MKCVRVYQKGKRRPTTISAIRIHRDDTVVSVVSKLRGNQEKVYIFPLATVECVTEEPYS